MTPERIPQTSKTHQHASIKLKKVRINNAAVANWKKVKLNEGGGGRAVKLAAGSTPPGNCTARNAKP